MRRVIEWNGRDLPAALRDLPPGNYVVEEERPLSGKEQEGLRQLAARAADALSSDCPPTEWLR
jgi:hypothetical protein